MDIQVMGVPYSITSDAYCFTLSELKIAEKGKKAGETVERTIGYYSNLEGLIKKLIELKIINLIESENINVALVEAIQAVKLKLIESFQIQGVKS